MTIDFKNVESSIANKIGENGRFVSEAWFMRQQGIVNFVIRTESKNISEIGEILFFQNREIGTILMRTDYEPISENGRTILPSESSYLIETTERNYKELVRDRLIPEVELIRKVGIGGYYDT
jgi:hypothetical protein